MTPKRKLAIETAKTFILNALDNLTPEEKVAWILTLGRELERLGLRSNALGERIRDIQEPLYMRDFITSIVTGGGSRT